ncbi:MAG: hypothetical protein HFH23_06480 [Ruminococcus sp.]|nr:hypothetical protein [Ruminococcus sp.]
MSGLDKIKSQILNEANASAAEKIARAKKEADAILTKAEQEVAEESERCARQAEEKVKNHAERVASACDMQRRKALLDAKQRMITDVLDKAYERVLSLPPEKYFAMVTNILAQYVQPEEGVMYFNKADLARLPEGFEAEVDKIAKSKGGSLTISNESKEKDGGFVLVYGGVEENCTIKAMFAAKRDEWSDLVQKVLF